MNDRQQIIADELTRIDGTAPTKDETALGKHWKMAVSPFRFLRGAAQLFYRDIANGELVIPEAFDGVPHTRIMGDCHFSNFGFFTEEGSHNDRVIWGPNDFDDAAAGPAIWDVMRFLVSIDLVADYVNGLSTGRYQSEESIPIAPTGISDKAIRKAKQAFLDVYQESCFAMQENAKARRKALDAFDEGHFLAPFLTKAQKRAIGGSRFQDKSTVGKLTRRNDDRHLVFNPDDERFGQLTWRQRDAIIKAFRPYLDDMVLDVVARHGAGTGSVNVERYYFLVGPSPDLPADELHLAHVVEVKQQREAAPIHHFPDLCPENKMPPAHLTVDCQQRMMRRPDLVLDEVMWKRSHWLVRSRHNARLGVDPEDLLGAEKPGKALRDYAAACGHVLARAHARGDRRSTRFENQMQRALSKAGGDLIPVSKDYADQVMIDHQILMDLLNDA